MHENTEFTLSRDCEAIQIPSGNTMTIPAGTKGVITQTLGGSYTIATPHGLSRIADKDLDALGLEKPASTNGAPKTTASGTVDEKAVWDQLKQCFDPEIPVNIVDLGLVYDCRLMDKPEGGKKVEVKMTLTAPASSRIAARNSSSEGSNGEPLAKAFIGVAPIFERSHLNGSCGGPGRASILRFGPDAPIYIRILF